jgi:flagellar FliL protein
MANVDDDLDLDVGKSSGGGKMKNIIIFSVIGLLLVGVSITTTLLLLGGGKEEVKVEARKKSGGEEEKKTHDDEESDSGKSDTTAYFDMTPPFVVNLNNQESDIRYLQVAVSLQLKKETDVEIIKKHLPVIRHNLVLLFSSLDFAEVRTTEGKVKLSERALKVKQDALKKATGKTVVEAVYLPSIVGQ